MDLGHLQFIFMHQAQSCWGIRECIGKSSSHTFDKDKT